MILGDTSSGKSNTEVAKINLKINSENVSNREDTIIRLRDVTITDGEFENSLDKQIVINLTNKKEIVGIQKVQQVKEVTTVSGEETVDAVSSTSSKNILPDAGIRKNLVIAIIALIFLTIIFKIKSRKIKY